MGLKAPQMMLGAGNARQAVPMKLPCHSGSGVVVPALGRKAPVAVGRVAHSRNLSRSPLHCSATGDKTSVLPWQSGALPLLPCSVMICPAVPAINRGCRAWPR